MTQSEPGGIWLLNEATGQLTYVETHKGSTIASAWCVSDSEHLDAIERGCDWLLNAAGAGVESYRRALRARWPGDTRGIPMEYPKPWQFWHRTIHGLSGGATRRMFSGDLDRATRVNGFTIDDSKDGDTVTGWQGGVYGSAGRLAEGPGRGGSAIYNGDAYAGGGGAGTAGASTTSSNSLSRGGRGGEAVPAGFVLTAVTMNDYAKANWLASGGGGFARDDGGSSDTGTGGASGSGLIRIGLNDLTESTNRTLTGSNGQAGSNNDARGGGGGGGVYLAISGGDYTQAANVNINCDGGAGAGVAGDGGNGHIIIMAHGDITFEATSTRTNAVVTQWRIITAPPPGGSLISS